MRRPGYSTPLVIAIMAFAVVAFLFLIDTAINPDGSKKNANTNATPTKNSNMAVCTDDAKVCPDGSSVGRSGPNCEFAECPAVNPNAATSSTANWKTYANNELGFQIKYPEDHLDLVAVTPSFIRYDEPYLDAGTVKYRKEFPSLLSLASNVKDTSCDAPLHVEVFPIEGYRFNNIIGAVVYGYDSEEKAFWKEELNTARTTTSVEKITNAKETGYRFSLGIMHAAIATINEKKGNIVEISYDKDECYLPTSTGTAYKGERTLPLDTIFQTLTLLD